MPGLRLNLPQLQRLSGLDAMTALLVVDVLEQIGFLRRLSDGTLVRVGADSPRR